MKFLVFLGSERDSTPPHPARLGLRVARACNDWLEAAGHETTLVDPLEVAPPLPFKPHFSYAPGKAPLPLQMLADQIADADGYVMVSPEYNHSMSPALAHLLNHFGSSLFSFKPSLIVTYSAGQWGGARAAMSMRGFLSELGCLPVSAMIHVPKAHDVFEKDGRFSGDADPEQWRGYIGRGFDQLTWWSEAAQIQRNSRGNATKAFTDHPSQRNAP